MSEQDPFNTNEQQIIDAVGAYESYARERREKLGEEAAKTMLTVVWRPTSDSDPYEVIEGEIRVPENFTPEIGAQAGYGDRLYFLDDNEAAPVLDEKSRGVLIVNRKGKAEKHRTSPRKVKKLARQGVTIQGRPLPQPHTAEAKERLEKITPSI